ncbi:putative reverse transcriptase domain-containing protein [Tanacetum coccineum]
MGEKTTDNKRKWEGNNNNNNNYNQNKRQEVARVYTAGQTDKGKYAGNLPYCNMCNRYHNGPCLTNCNNYGRVGHMAKDCRSPARAANQGNQNNQRNTPACYGCGQRGHYLNELDAAVHDNNVVTGTFLINNHYASVLFDSSVDRSFASTTFSEYLNIIPTTLDTVYHVELANRKSVATDTILRGCTLNLQNHPFNIDLIPIELGSFDVIIGMDWLSKYHAVIACYEKQVCIPCKNEVLVRQGVRSESRMCIILCIKTQKYIEKGCPVFLIQVTEKGTEEKQLKDLPIMRYFSEVFPEDLPGLPPARQVKFQIDLVPGAAPVARAPYRLAPAVTTGNFRIFK